MPSVIDAIANAMVAMADGFFAAEVVCEECTTIADLLGGDDDIQLAEERLTEWFLGHDCDEESVREQMSKSFDPDLIPSEVWQKHDQCKIRAVSFSIHEK